MRSRKPGANFLTKCVARPSFSIRQRRLRFCMPAGDDAGDLFGGHHLRFVARGCALLRAVGRKGREANVGCRETRAGDHHVQSLFKVFDAQRFEETRHGVLRGRIARAPRQPVQPGDGRDADNRTVRLLEVRQGELAAVDRTPEIDVHQAVQHLQVDVVENGAHRKPGVANQHVDPPNSRTAVSISSRHSPTSVTSTPQ